MRLPAMLLFVLLAAGACAAPRVDISEGWRFKPDPEGVGERLGYQRPSFDDSGWATLDAGRSWEEQGFPDYDGLAWYRREVRIPEGFRRPVLLFEAVDDDYRVYVNGRLAGDFHRGQSTWDRPSGVDISPFVKPGEKAVVAVLVEDWGGGGGLNGKVYLYPSPEAVVPRWVDLSRGWRFRTDRKDVGLKEGWFEPNFPDSGWATLDAGKPWEEQGFPDYDGLAWYRKWVRIPADWSEAWICFGGVDDEYDLFVNGRRVAHFGDRSKGAEGSVWRTPTRADITRFVKFGEENLICLRVLDWGDKGGLRFLPAVVSNSRLGAAPPGEVVRFAARLEGSKVWPKWATGPGVAWTATGAIAGISEALMGLDGAVQPRNKAPTAEVWVYDRASRRLLAPQRARQTSWRLLRGYLPVPVFRWREGWLEVEGSLFVWPPRGKDKEAVSVALWRLRNLSSGPRRVRVYLVVRPYSVDGGVNPTHRIRFDDRTGLIVADEVAFGLPLPRPQGFGASGWGREISGFALKGALPREEEASDPMGLAGGAAVYDVVLPPAPRAFEISLVSPLSSEGPSKALARRLSSVKPREALGEVAREWERLLKRVKVRLPDIRVEEGLYALLAYALVMLDDDMLHPGPLYYDSFWYRDSTYIVAAMDRMGLHEIARRCLGFFVAMQKPNGEFPSIVSLQREPVGPPEWDSQGEAIWALVHHFRLTRDTNWLRSVYPAIRKGCEFLRELRKQRLAEKFKGTPLFGILPPSVSAEDLGPGSWHHYWDDFWAVGGLREAAYAARALGFKGDAEWMEREAEDLLRCTLESAKLLMRKHGIGWIPNGPEDLISSSMARGTSPALWPCRVLDPDDPIVKRSFDVYWEKWVEPYGGGYLHGGNFWPYATLELAHCYLFLGRRGRVWGMLDWALRNQTARGVYAWAEVADPRTGLRKGGDMPHCWMSGEYINLVRDILLYEDGGRLVLLSGVPRRWLEGEILFEGAPTYFGKLSLSVKPVGGGIALTLGGCRPPRGFVVKLPVEVKEVEVDGRGWRNFRGGVVMLPPGARRAVIKFVPSP